MRSRGSSVYTRAPHGGVHEFGGTIRPKGAPIKIEKSEPIYGAIAEKTNEIEDQLGGLLDGIAAAHGFIGSTTGAGVSRPLSM